MYENLKKDGFSVNVEKLESIEDPSEKVFVKSLLDYFEKNGVPGGFRCTGDDFFENLNVRSRLYFLDDNPGTEPRPRYLHYGRYMKMGKKQKEALSLIVETLSGLTLPSGEKVLDIYRRMPQDEQMTVESIVDDVFHESRRNSWSGKKIEYGPYSEIEIETDRRTKERGLC